MERVRRAALVALAAGVAVLGARTANGVTEGRSRPDRHVRVDCDAGESIAHALPGLHAGDTLLVRGTCRESVQVPVQTDGVTLDGGGTAILQHPGGVRTGAGRHGVFIRGRSITITGFTIRGGYDGVHLSGPAHAVIDGNRIVENDGRGIHLDKGSVAQIAGNTISRNGGAGIHVSEGSYARIGFLIPPEEQPRPNRIADNGGDGIHVERSSSAWIAGNSIAGNDGSGVAIDRGSECDVTGNAIDGNGGDGVRVSRGSGLNLESPGTPRDAGPNRTDGDRLNAGVGVRCSVAGYVEGPLGSLRGEGGGKAFGSGCVDRVTS